MANDFYTHSSYPATGSQGSSALARAEFDAVTAGFDKMPALAGNAGKFVVINSGASALSVASSISESAGNLSISGSQLTIAPATVTWSGNPTHSGNHTFSGNLAVGGTLTVNGAASLSATNVRGTAGAYSFRVTDAAGAGDRLRIVAGAANNGVAIDVTDNGETTTARPLTLGATNTTVYLGSSTQFTKDSNGNVWLGGLPPFAGWRSSANAFRAGIFATLHTASNGATTLGFGAIESGTNAYSYSTTGDTPTLYQQITGQHTWYAASGAGTAGQPITFNTLATLNSIGLGIGKSPGVSLDVVGSFHLGSSAADDGTYLRNAGANELTLSGGAIYNNFSSPNYVFLAKYSSASGYRTAGGAHYWWGNTGLTAGTTFNSATQMTLDSAGNLGLGKTPAQKLDVQLSRGSANTYEAPQGISLRLQAASGYAAALVLQDVAATSWTIAKTANVDQLSFHQSDYISGTSAPRFVIDAGGASAYTSQNANGLTAVFRAGPTGTNGGALNFYNWNNSSADINLARIYCQTTSGTAGSEAGELFFYTKPNGGALTSRLRIQDAGQVDIQAGSGNLRIGGNITRFESAEQSTPSTSTVVSVAHGGPRAPDIIRVVYRCKTAEHGFSVGDEIDVRDDVSDTSREVQVYANATNVAFQYIGSTTPAIRNTSNTTVALTAANWRVVLRCIWL